MINHPLMNSKEVKENLIASRKENQPLQADWWEIKKKEMGKKEKKRKKNGKKRRKEGDSIKRVCVHSLGRKEGRKEDP